MYQLFISNANACAVDTGMETQSYNKDTREDSETCHLKNIPF